MRGTALVVLLCLLTAIAAHVLSEDARARSRAADDDVALPTECETYSCHAADAATDVAMTKP